MASLTAANAVIHLSITNLYTSPQNIQGFAADDIFTMENLTPIETVMGVDGLLSGGWTATPKNWTITLQADSLSNQIFDQWYQSQERDREAFIANGTVTLISVGATYTMTRGFLTGAALMSDARRILQPRRWRITWQSITSMPV